jgi:hypothetical protein
MACFAPGRVAFLERLSRSILAHPRLRRDAAGASLGFWLRPAHLAELKGDFERRAPSPGRRVPAGLVVHFAPGNVDTMFVYSWALSFLAGNANIVRLSSRESPVVEDLLSCVNEAIGADPSGFEGNLFITYGHDDAVTARLSSVCDTRVIWGGDETVRRIRAIPISPHATDRAFASKRSLSVFDPEGYLAADAGARSAAADQMAVDLAPFGQMACSSPHELYWLGGVGRAREAGADFTGRLEAAMARRLGEPDTGLAVRRIQHAFLAAAEGRAASMVHSPFTTLVLSPEASRAESGEPCGGGFLTLVEGISVAELTSHLRPDHQTITYFGLGEGALSELAAAAGAAGVDRIVPVGRALDFGPLWDGYDLWCDFARVVVIL